MSDIDVQKRQEQMLRQFQRIDKFLRANSKKFYQEYDTVNSQLVDIRVKLMDYEEAHEGMLSEELAAQMGAVAQIDGEDGIASRLNMMTLILARIANPQLFKFFIQENIDVEDIEHLSFLQIPLEADAVLFITNPMLVFNLLAEFVHYRKRFDDVIHLYISNRIARWLFRFTQFVMVYDQFEKIVHLTLLQPKRFHPFRKQFVEIIHQLCSEVSESILNEEKSVYMNDLRRLYLILARALFISAKEGEPAPQEVCDAIDMINSVVDLAEDQLEIDGILKEFQSFHFMFPKDQFVNQYSMLQGQDVQHTLVFLGHLHPLDRLAILAEAYHRSKSYPLYLFSSVKTFYHQNMGVLPKHYRAVIDTLQEIVTYEDVQKAHDVEDSLLEELFIDKKLSLGELAEHQGMPVIEVKEIKQGFVPLDTIFSTFRQKPEEAKKKNYLYELTRYPFYYVTVEYGKSLFNLVTLGEICLLAAKAYKDFVGYLLGSGQLTQIGCEVCLKQHKDMIDLIKSMTQQYKLQPASIRMYDQNKRLRFYDLVQASRILVEKLKTRNSSFLLRRQYQQMLFDLLEEVHRWLARKKNIAVDELSPKWIPQLIVSDSMPVVYEAIKTTQIGLQYSKQLDALLENVDQLGKELIDIHEKRQKILKFEIIRTESRENADSSETEKTSSPKSSHPKKQENLSILNAAGKEAFKAMSENPEQKEQWLLEWGRIPFRFVENRSGKETFVLLTFTDMVAINLDGKTRNAFMNYLVNTKQLTLTQQKLMKQHMVSFVMILKRLTQGIEWPDGPPVWVPDEGKLDFSKLAGLIKITNEIIFTQLKKMALAKEELAFYMLGIDKIHRLFINLTYRPYSAPSIKEVYQILDSTDNLNKVLEAIKETSLSRRYSGFLTRHSKNLEALAKQVKAEFQINAKILTLHHLGTAAPEEN